MMSIITHYANKYSRLRCGVLCNVGPAHAAVRLLPPKRPSQQSATNAQYQQLADDVDIIDSLFEAATANQDGKNQPGRPPPGTKQQASPNSTSQQGRRAPNLPQRATQLPWSSSDSKFDAPQQMAAKVLQQLKLKRAGKQFANKDSTSSSSSSSSSKPCKVDSDITSQRPPGTRQSSGRTSVKQLYTAAEDIDLDTSEIYARDWSASNSSADEPSEPVPINPWLLRQQQQRQQRRKLAKQRAAAAAAAAREQQEKAERLAAAQPQRPIQQRQQGQPISQQQQQEQLAHIESMSSRGSAAATVLKQKARQQLLQRQQQHEEEQQQHAPQGQLILQMEQPNMQVEQPAAEETARQAISNRSSSSNSSARSSAPDVSGTDVHTGSRSPSSQQPSTMPEQQDIRATQQQRLYPQPSTAASDDGIIRSARRQRMQRLHSATTIAPQVQQQQQEQQRDGRGSLPAAASETVSVGSNVADTCASLATNIGQSPLVVLGGQAAGSTVVWTQQASIAAAGSLQDSATAAAAAAPPQQQVQQQMQWQQQQGAQQQQQQQRQWQQSGAHSATQQQLHPSVRQSSAGSADSPALQPQGVKQTAAAAAAAAVRAGIAAGAAGTRRFRRGRSLQGMASSPPPIPEDQLAEPVVPAAVDEATTSGAWQLPAAAATDTAERHISSSSSSSSSGIEKQEVQQQHSRLDSSNWQQLAGQLLPDLYDSTWHSSLYTLMQDVWKAVLKPGAQSAVGQPVTGAAAAVGNYGDSSSQSTAVAWAMACLYNDKRYIWASALLALVECLAVDDSADVQLAVQAVRVLPVELLEQLVLPAAGIIDDEVHSALQQQLKQKLTLGEMSNSTAAAAAAMAAAQSLFGPTPWAINQQKQQQRTRDRSGQHTSGLVTKTGSGGTAAALEAPDVGLSEVLVAAPSAAPVRGVPGAGQVADMLLELQQLQKLYPGVELAALAHITTHHGLWSV